MCLGSKYLHLHIFILSAQTQDRLHLHFMIFQFNSMHHNDFIICSFHLLNKFDPINGYERYETQMIRFDIMSTSGFSSFIETHFFFGSIWWRKKVSHAEMKFFFHSNIIPVSDGNESPGYRRTNGKKNLKLLYR